MQRGKKCPEKFGPGNSDFVMGQAGCILLAAPLRAGAAAEEPMLWVPYPQVPTSLHVGIGSVIAVSCRLLV